jgi:hypothetical protein
MVRSNSVLVSPGIGSWSARVPYEVFSHHHFRFLPVYYDSILIYPMPYQNTMIVNASLYYPAAVAAGRLLLLMVWLLRQAATLDLLPAFCTLARLHHL